MKVKEVSIVYRRTWQTQQYESITEEVALSAELEDGDTEKDAARQLLDSAQEIVREHVRPTLERAGKIKPKTTPKLSGLEIINGNSTPTAV